jgi:dCTP deaminase
LEKGGSVGRAAELLGCSISTLKRRFRHVIDEAQRDGLIRNHKVVEVVHLDYKEDVYCLTVPGTHNFALEAGVFVHNCGLVINVTPLEPEWEGHVTLEISNTTPLPARVYANEGIAQFLFLGADEVCKTSYKDRNGKYQGQTGVVPPRT